jgi:hypothetical protein
MHNLGLDQAGRRTFWCPRCGTLKTEASDFTSHESPKWTRDDGGVPGCVRTVAVRTVALRKLLEAKDAAVRAALNPGG